MQITLNRGWNLFSFSVMPDSTNPNAVLSSIDGDYKVIEGFDGESTWYYPDRPAERNSLTELDPFHGYWIKLRKPAVLEITGEPVPPTTPLHLDSGWNLVSHLAEEPLPVAEALASIDGLYIAVHGYDEKGQSYYPSLPSEINTLYVLSPGNGYMIYMSSPGTLIYPQ